jgi:hypothetical protein
MRGTLIAPHNPGFKEAAAPSDDFSIILTRTLARYGRVGFNGLRMRPIYSEQEGSRSWMVTRERSVSHFYLVNRDGSGLREVKVSRPW